MTTTDNPTAPPQEDSSSTIEEYVGIRNITGKINERRGSVRSFNFNGSFFYVEPGNSIKVPKKFYQRVKDNKDSYGQKIWELVSLGQVQGNNNSHRKRAYLESEDEAALRTNIDHEFISTVENLVHSDETFDAAIEYIGSGDSHATIAKVLATYSSNQAMDNSKKNQIVSACVKRITQLKKAASEG